MDILAFLLATEYGPYIVAFCGSVGAIVTAASLIVPLTKTPKDDEIVGKIKGFIDRFSIFEPKK